MVKHIYKHPRLYLNGNFAENAKISLMPDHAHYLKNVLRKGEGDMLRVFNGSDGEYLARIEELNKKNGIIALTEQTREQPSVNTALNIYFSPIKKQRMDFLIEKAVELGVSGLYPVIMNRTENRKFNMDRTSAQIIEASEQCERLNLPKLHEPQKLRDVIGQGKALHICMERDLDSKPISSYSYKDGVSFMIGPEGGFDDDEIRQILASDNINLVDLGSYILRAETAVIACLSYAKYSEL